jgi:hypothetical protein
LIDEIGIPAGAKGAPWFSLLGLEGFVGRPMVVPKGVESDKPENMHKIWKYVCKVRRRRSVKHRSSFANVV